MITEDQYLNIIKDIKGKLCNRAIKINPFVNFYSNKKERLKNETK